MTGIPIEAPRWRRLLAACIDLALVAALALILAVVIGAYEHHEDWAGLRPQLSAMGLAGVSYLLINFRWLRCGQTVGKRLLGIRVVAVRDNANRAFHWHLLRLLPLLPVAAVFFHIGYGMAMVIGVLPIFLPMRRCLHDFIAGTRVVRDS